MIKKSNFFAVLTLSLAASAAIFAQESGTVTVTPATPAMPLTQSFEFFGGSYLGVVTTEITNENFSKFGLKDVRGLGVEKVTENSPAAKAGLQNGDVIIRFEGEEVSSARKLQRMIGEISPDHTAKVTVLRSGSERDFTVTIGKHASNFSYSTGNFTMAMPAMPVMPAMPNFQITPMPNITVAPGAWTEMGKIEGLSNLKNLRTVPNGDNMVWSFAFGRRIGVGTSSLGKQLGDYFGVADGKGVLVTSVSDDSPASKAGLKAGDVIVEADGKAIDDSGDLMKAINAKEKGSVNLTIVRNKNRQTISVEPEESKGGNNIYRMTPGTPIVRGAVTVAPRVGVRTTVTPRIKAGTRVVTSPRDM